MRELRKYGSVRGAPSNGRPYRDHILDDGEFALVLANAAHVKNVPGRKTDVNDAMWLAELLAHGLIRASFVPDTQTQEMQPAAHAQAIGS